MARLILLLLMVGLSIPAEAQTPTRYWVFFTDKTDVASKDRVAPITERALVRRARRADRVPSNLDRPVSSTYVHTLTDLGVEIRVQSRWLNAVSAPLTAEQLEEVEALPFVRGVQPVGVLLAPEGSPASGTQFGPAQPPGAPALRLDYGDSFTQLNFVNALPGLESGLSGAGVRLGIIDTGVGDLSQAAVAPIVNSGRLIGQEDFTGFPDDGSRHGLAVLSIAAGFDEGDLIGPAYGAEILLARTEYTPTETNQEEDNFVAGIEWMESEGVDVVNISLGYSRFDPDQSSYVYADMDGDTPLTTRAADLAAKLGVTVVNSAGNEGSSSWFYITSPADGDSVITVGAVDAQDQAASFSGHGPTADGRIKPDVTAQGVFVRYASRTGYSHGNGTSFSAPMVAAIATQMLEVNADLKPMDILDILKATTYDSQNPDFVADNTRGWGRVNAEAALALAATYSTASDSSDLPSSLSAQVYPNPASGPATLVLNLDVASPAEVEVFDLLGRRVGRLDFSRLNAGRHLLDLPMPAGAVGWYGYRVTAGGSTVHGTLTVIR
ncbi:MAG: S8 family serine peptidase [Rhodothermales bacterium]|nr:S8 family serine peptidase [Rhodothermales bacterium]